jgi:hypothetical protein
MPSPLGLGNCEAIVVYYLLLARLSNSQICRPVRTTISSDSPLQ